MVMVVSAFALHTRIWGKDFDENHESVPAYAFYCIFIFIIQRWRSAHALYFYSLSQAQSTIAWLAGLDVQSYDDNTIKSIMTVQVIGESGAVPTNNLNHQTDTIITFCWMENCLQWEFNTKNNKMLLLKCKI